MNVRVARAVTSRVDVWIGGSAVLVHHNAIRALEACGLGQLVARTHSNADEDYVGRVTGAVIAQNCARSPVRSAFDLTYLGTADDADSVTRVL
jgi:hypothetical protein